MRQSRTLRLVATLALLAAGPLGALANDDNPETLAEQARALAAERAGGATPLVSGSAPGSFVLGPGPLFIGVDDITVPAYRLEVPSGTATQAFLGFEVWGAAYDATNDRVLFNDGAMLYEWPVGGTPNLLGTITSDGSTALTMVSLAWFNDTLYSTRNIANEAVYTIDMTTLIATVLIDYVDADFDFGGLAIDQSNGDIYGTNDDTTPNGNGLFRINMDGSGTLITAYPGGETDIDGLAIGGGFAYFVTDQPGDIYVWDLAGGAFTTPVPNPWTTSEVFSGAGWIEAGGPQIQVDPTSLSSTQPVDVQVTVPLDITNVGTSDLIWDITEDAGLVPGQGRMLRPRRPTAPPPANELGAGVGGFSRAPDTGEVRSATPERGEVPEGSVTITHSATQNIVSLNSVSCNAGGLHTDNSYIRAFDLATFGITSDFSITEVEIGIETATGAGGTQPVDLNLYTWDPLDPFTFANFVAIGTTSTMVTDQSLTIITVPVTGVAPAGSTLVVEFFTPNGQAAGNSLFVGSNPDGQTAPTYLAAADCGVPEPTDTAALGFPNMHLVMNVTGQVGCSDDLPWVSANPTAGTTGAGLTDTVDVTFDSTGLIPGLYEGNLCVNSNDPASPEVLVPLSLTVDSMPFLDGFETGDTSRWSLVVP